MDNMIFKTFKDALDNLQKYEPVIGYIPDNLDTSIRGLIVGIANQYATQMIYLPHQDVLDTRPDLFTKDDLTKIEYWAILRSKNDKIIPLNEVLVNPIIDEYLNNGGRYRRLTVTQDWSTPINIPRGLDVRLYFDNSPSFEFIIKDSITEQATNGTVSTENNEKRETFFIGYMHTNYNLRDMARATISFRLKDKNSHPVEISLEFQWT
jgi:hypothetical protein